MKKHSVIRRALGWFLEQVSLHKVEAVYAVLLFTMCLSPVYAQNELQTRVEKLLDMVVLAGIGLVGLGLVWVGLQFMHGSGDTRSALTSVGIGSALIFGAKGIATALK